jgi:small subunit ribosomal protein S18
MSPIEKTVRKVYVPRGESVDYKNLELLMKCMGPQGQILSRKRTGFTAHGQRELKRAIKRARHLGLLPFVA